MDEQHKMHGYIAKWLAGEATDEEMAILNHWAGESAENRAHLAAMEKIWDAAEEEDDRQLTDRAWNEINPRISKQPMRLVYRAAALLAACFAVFLAGRIFWPAEKISDQPQAISRHHLYISSGSESFATALPDGTTVLLQPNSSIEADSGFGRLHRLVTLKGTAHFKTVHGIKGQFMVNCGQFTVRDIGTAFTVSEEKADITVKVTEGKIQIMSKKDSAYLETGDSAVLDRLEQKLRVIKEKTTEMAAEVKDKILNFQKTELKKVGQTLSALYHVDIRLNNPAIENCKLTATFDNQSLETVLDVIREAFNLEITHKGGVIYLDGKGCQ